MTEPASEKQVNYLKVLVHKLRDLTDGQNEIADKIDDAAGSMLSKRDASDLIEALIASVEALGGKIRKTPKEWSPQKQADPPNVIAARRAREAADIARQAWNKKQIEIFGGEGPRPPPAGNAPMKIWQERAPYDNGRYYDRIDYRWVWVCSHEDHKHVNGRYGVVKGGSHRGRDVTFANALTHWKKYHDKEEES